MTRRSDNGDYVSRLIALIFSFALCAPAWASPSVGDVLTIQANHVPRFSAPSGAVDPNTCGIRLYSLTGVAYPTSNQTALTTIYAGPFGAGNGIALWNGSALVQDSMSETSFSVASTVWDLRDIFVYDNSGTPAIEDDSWASSQVQTTITAATAAAPCVLTVSSGTGITVGALVGIDTNGGSGTLLTNAANGISLRVWKVSAVSGTSVTLEGSDTTGLTYTSGGRLTVIPTTRSTGLTLQSGFMARSGATTRRYIGTYMAGANGVSGQCEDSTSIRGIWSQYGQQWAKLSAVFPNGTTWTWSSTSTRAADNNTAAGASRVCCVIGNQQRDNARINYDMQYYGGAGFQALANIGVNSCIANSADQSGLIYFSSSYLGSSAKLFKSLSIGYSFIQAEDGDTNSTSVNAYGNQYDSRLNNGLYGEVLQ